MSLPGSFLGALEGVLEALGGLLEAFEGVLEALGGALEAEVLQDSAKNPPRAKNIENCRVDWASLDASWGL